ncbi:hypothetical protein [Aquimarina algiphila]|uniref:DUF4468 domain-containing protein n=1 Tax=Aquimarina algiphila TaxID=2047982 RepID=A0A554VDZ2_9FLAO|nr:hypothetical protein [Aquimarina algiphila]TSE05209.1 hypothetical protein FOF46_23385 [Aquimarina algiphila]
MKITLSLSILLFSISIYSQKLQLNEKNNFFQFSKVVNHTDEKIAEQFYNRFQKINLTEITESKNNISGIGVTNHLVMGFALVEIFYKVKIDFKPNKYRLVLTNFKLKDKNGTTPLEGSGSFKRGWIKKINKKLPEIIQNIENINSKDDDW